jgi:hypothetical protein
MYRVLSFIVMAALEAAIQDVDARRVCAMAGRVEPGHDETGQ